MTAKKKSDKERDDFSMDVTVGDLFGKPKRSEFWQAVLKHLKQQWVDPYPHRMTDVRCGTVYLSNRSGTYGAKNEKRWTAGRIVIELRFPLNLRYLRDIFDKLEAKYKEEWAARTPPTKAEIATCRAWLAREEKRGKA